MEFYFKPEMVPEYSRMPLLEERSEHHLRIGRAQHAAALVPALPACRKKVLAASVELCEILGKAFIMRRWLPAFG